MSSIFRPSDATTTNGVSKSYLDSLQLASKAYVNSAIESIHVSGESEATPSTLVQRDENGDSAFNEVTCNSIRISDGAANTKVLVSDDDGNGKWLGLGASAWTTYASTANPGTLVMRDNSGGCAVTDLVCDELIADSITLSTEAGAGKVLTSDADGNASWQAVPTPDLSPYATISGGAKMMNKQLEQTSLLGTTSAAYITGEDANFWTLQASNFKVMTSNLSEGRVLTCNEDGDAD